MERTINLPETLDVTSRDIKATLDVSKLSPAMLSRAVLHGLTQRIADGAAGSAGRAALAAFDADGVDKPSKELVKKWTMDAANLLVIQQQAENDMLKVVNTLYAGTWAQATHAAKRSPVEELAYSMAYADLKQYLTAHVGNAKALTGKGKPEQRVLVAKWCEQVETDYTAQAQEQLDRRAEAEDNGETEELLAALGIDA